MVWQSEQGAFYQKEGSTSSIFYQSTRFELQLDGNEREKCLISQRYSQRTT
jgi:hypothetical protein